MNWYDYIACLFAGMFLANVVPHFVHGISGEMFPTPFANPPGRGMSPATVNVLWALSNLIVGYLLLWRGRFSFAKHVTLIVASIGFAAMAINLSIVFAGIPK